MSITAPEIKTNGTAKKNIKEAASAAKSDYESLKADISQLRDDIKSLAGNSSEYLKGKSAHNLEKGVEQSKEFYSKAKDEAVKGRSYVEDQVKSHPLAAVGIAFGTGVLLAALRRR